MNNNIIYSIIIPHYNVPLLLNRCLKSIPNRPDVQVIVVDDLSPDREKYNEIIPELKRKNVELYVVDEKKRGGHARNIGIEHAKGKWLLFADSDDYFNYCIDDIFDEYANADYDCVFFNATILDTNTYQPTSLGQRPASYFRKLEKNQALLEYKLRYLFGQPWCKMVKRDMLLQHDIWFEETIIHNDTQFSYLLGYYAKKVKMDSRCLYAYMVRQGSVSKQKLIDEVLMARIGVFARKYVFLRDHGIANYKPEAHIGNVLLHYKKQHNNKQLQSCFNLLKEIGLTSSEIRHLYYKRMFEKTIIGKIINKIWD